MAKSVLEKLHGIIAAGKRQAGRVLEQLEGQNQVSLQPRELVTPAKHAYRASGDAALSARPTMPWSR